MVKDPFELLKIERTNNKKDIRRAYSRLAKECHPDENPEQFELLQEAYQSAMKMADDLFYNDSFALQDDVIDDISDDDAETIEEYLEDDIYEDIADITEENTLLTKMYEYELNKKPEDYNSPALNKLMALYNDEKSRKNKKIWQEYFISDLFLDEQISENFESGLACFLNSIEIEDDPNKVPAQFILEISSAYGLFYMDEMLLPSFEVYGGNLSNIESKAVEAIMTFFYRQNEEWKNVRANSLFIKPEAIVRMNSFKDYLKAYKVARSGNMIENRSYYFELFSVLGMNHLVEDIGRIDAKQIAGKRDVCIIPLFVHLINSKLIPVSSIFEIYEKLNLETIESSSAKKYHLPIKEAIMNSYGEYFEKENRLTDDEIRAWIRKFSQIPIDFAKGESGEEEPIWQNRVDELLKHQVWIQKYLEPLFINTLLEKVYFDEAPLYMLETLKGKYIDCGEANSVVESFIEKMDAFIADKLWRQNRFANSTPVKVISISDLNKKERAQKIHDALWEYIKLNQSDYKPSKDGICFLNNINHVAQPEEDESILDVINGSCFKGFSYSYVVLKGKVESRVVQIALFDECIIDPMYEKYFLQNSDKLKQKLAKTNVSIKVIGFLCMMSKYHCPYPIGIGDDGKIYTIIEQIKARGFESLVQLLEKEVESEGLGVFDSIQIYTKPLVFDNNHRQYYLENS